MYVYQIFWHCQCLNDLRVQIYDLGTLTTWLTIIHAYAFVACCEIGVLCS